MRLSLIALVASLAATLAAPAESEAGSVLEARKAIICDRTVKDKTYCSRECYAQVGGNLHCYQSYCSARSITGAGVCVCKCTYA